MAADKKLPPVKVKGKSPTDGAESTACGVFLKYAMIVSNIFILLVGLASVAVGIWIAVDRNFLSNVLSTELVQYVSASYILIIAGFIVSIVALIGCCGSRRENRCLLLTYFIILTLMFIILLCAAILAIVFRAQVGTSLKSLMGTTLKRYYGKLRIVTDGWDATQSRLDCCAIEEQDWGIYNQSEWIKDINGAITYKTPGYRYVPATCCQKDSSGNYRNLEACQTSQLMPPGTMVGSQNDDLHYRGCYSAGKEFLIEHSSILLGLGIALSLLLLCGMIFSILLFLRIPKNA
ncbi:CD151 antigen-like [Tubulanus polymorphus]|uniref:CD151 antigen-like n=1 Tax=Tubulanus polymorphus TaxID=672921 RepID=UPI003DA2E6A8